MKKILKEILTYLFGNKRVTLTMFRGLFIGIKLNVSIKNQLGLVLNSVEPHLQKFLEKNLKKGDTVLDIGSNIGYTSILMSRLVGKDGNVYAFEPMSQNLAILHKNISLNNCKNITVIDKALSDKNGEIDFFTPLNGEELSMSSMVWGNGIKDWKKQLVKTICLDDNADLKDLSPKLIKIDVEGAEGIVVTGMQKLIARSKPSIFIECTEKGREITWTILKTLNYSCFMAQDDKKEVVDLSSYKHNDFIWIPNL
jgi:FkbM family methyltransferase